MASNPNNNLKRSPIPAVPRTMKIVNTDGTVTRSGQLLLEQLQPATTLEGTHAKRPDPKKVPDGAIYVESDRSVIYYNIDGEWHYVAGTMWGTVSPDQRPTDLGVNDSGFDYRGTDDAREFLWSGTAWVEVTAVRYGSHSGRPPAASVATGVLYVEWDRGSVIYQMQMSGTTPVWQYLAGTMWGTVSPDQRPTDLGAHDVGFDYRGTDQQREFIWSGGMWVEVTPLPQTPWQSNIDGANHTLTNVNAIGIGTSTAATSLDIVGADECVRLETASPNGPYIRLYSQSAQRWVFGHCLGAAPAGSFVFLSLVTGAPTVIFLGGGGIAFPSLPSANPGAGTKQLWFDPADANRVKFAP